MEQVDTHESLTQSGETEQFLTFIMNGEEYGVDILRVQEIRGWTQPTVIPNSPKYIRGVINLRGAIVPIIDLRERLNIETIPYSQTTVVIVLKVHSEGKDRITGIVVDGVSDVYSLDRNEIKPPPDFGASADLDFAKGIVTVDEKMIVIFDIDRLLNARDLLPQHQNAA